MQQQQNRTNATATGKGSAPACRLFAWAYGRDPEKTEKRKVERIPDLKHLYAVFDFGTEKGGTQET